MALSIRKTRQSKFGEILAMMRKGLWQIELRFNGVDMKIDRLERCMEKLADRLDSLEERTTNLKTQQEVHQRTLEFHETRLRVGSL